MHHPSAAAGMVHDGPGTLPGGSVYHPGVQKFPAAASAASEHPGAREHMCGGDPNGDLYNNAF